MKTIIPVPMSFKMPVAPGQVIKRSTNCYVISWHTGNAMIDSGVSEGSDRILESLARSPSRESKLLALTHAHPDHIGGALRLWQNTSCRVAAHAKAVEWVELPEKQAVERPLPGFGSLVGGGVRVNHTLNDGDRLRLNEEDWLEVLHTPGHSDGSVCYLHRDSGTLFTGDTVPIPHALPIYTDALASIRSLKRLQNLSGIQRIYPGWGEPVAGEEAVKRLLQGGMQWLQQVHQTVCQVSATTKQRYVTSPMSLCREVVARLNLPPFSTGPIIAQAFTSHLECCDDTDLNG